MPTKSSAIRGAGPEAAEASTASVASDSRPTAAGAAQGDRWWPTVAGVLGTAAIFLILALVLCYLAFVLRSGAFDFADSETAHSAAYKAAERQTRAELRSYAVLSSKSLGIVAPVVAAILATVLVWLAIPASGSSDDADRIRHVRAAVSRGSHILTSAVIAWVGSASLLAFAVAPQTTVPEPPDAVGFIVAWTLLPVTFMLGICCGRFTGGDAKYRFDAARAEVERRQRHVRWLTRTTSRGAGRQRRRWPFAVSTSSEDRDVILIVAPQVAVALLTLPVLMLGAGAASEIPAVVLSMTEVIFAIVTCVVASVIGALVCLMLNSGAVMRGIIALGGLGLAGAFVATFFVSSSAATAERADFLRTAGWTALVVMVVQYGLFTMPFGRHGAPLANYALRAADRSLAEAEQSLAAARKGYADAADDHPAPVLLTPAQACRYLNVSRQAFRRMRRTGEVTPRRVHGDLRYSKADLDAVLRRIAASRSGSLPPQAHRRVGTSQT